MNPYQHSDLAASIYELIGKTEYLSGVEQGDAGSFACAVADMLANDYGLELQPHEMAT